MVRNRHFIFLWLVSIFTTLATELFTITVLVAVFEDTGSTLQAAGTMAARMLPAFVLGPAAGVIVDRYPRKNVLIIMNVAHLLLISIALWLLWDGASMSVIAVYLIMLGLASADVFHRPARVSLIPSLVTQDELVQANSFILVSAQIVLGVSYALGGWLIQTVSLRNISVAIAILFAASILVAALMVVPKRVREDGDDSAEKESVTAAFVSGWRYLQRHAIARPLTIMETIEHVPHGIWTGALLLAFTLKALNGTTSDWGYIVTGYFAGMIAGSLFSLGASNWLGRYPGRIIVSTAALAGLLTLIFAVSQSVFIAVALASLFGPPFALRDVAQDALLQSTVDENQLGRVYATREMLRSVVFMLAGLFFAWLSDIIPIRNIYIIGGIIYLFTGVYALSNKALRTSTMNPTTT